MVGEARTEREGATLEAGEIDYQDAEGMLDARGSPMLFSEGKILVGRGDPLLHRFRSGASSPAPSRILTRAAPSGSSAAAWRRTRVPAASTPSRSEITSCDLPDPHYHFSAGEVKWIHGAGAWWPGRRCSTSATCPSSGCRSSSRTGGPAGTPASWCPASASTTSSGRRRLQAPDHQHRVLLGGQRLLRPDRPLRLARERYTHARVLRPVPLARPVHQRLHRPQPAVGGRTAAAPPGVIWDHHQVFSLSSSLNLSLNYVTNSSIVRNNAIDPLLTTQQITSALNYTHRYNWGTLTLGGNLRQNLENNSLTSQLPAVTAEPEAGEHRPARDLVARPLLHHRLAEQAAALVRRSRDPAPDGTLDTLARHLELAHDHVSVSRPRSASGDFNWRNSLRVTDFENNIPDRDSDLGPGSRQPGRFAAGDHDLQRAVLDRTRLGHRHQPAAPLPRLLEAAALGRA